MPGWFRITTRFLKGVEYVSNAGFTRAPAPATSSGTAEKHAPAQSSSNAKGTGSADSVVIVCVLAQIERLIARPCGQACAELAGLVLPPVDDGRDREAMPEPEVTLNLGGDDANGPDIYGSAECEEVAAEEEDDDDFVFEPLDSAVASEKSFLASLLPPQPSPNPAFEEASGRERGWEDGGECLRKLAHMAKLVSYARVASDWARLDVSALVVRILRRLVELPAQVWAAELAGDWSQEAPSAAGEEARQCGQEACVALMLHLCLLVRSRLWHHPDESSTTLAPLIHLLLDQKHKAGSGEPVAQSLLNSLLVHLCAAAVGVPDESASAAPLAQDQDKAQPHPHATPAAERFQPTSLVASHFLPALVSQEGAARCRAVWGTLAAHDLEAACRYLARRAAACPPPSAVTPVCPDGGVDVAEAAEDGGVQEDEEAVGADEAVYRHERVVLAVAASVAVGTSGEGGGLEVCGAEVMLKSGLVAALAHRLTTMHQALPSHPHAAGSNRRRAQLAAACRVGADGLLVMAAVSPDLASYLARLAHVAAPPGAAGGAGRGPGALGPGSLTTSQRVAFGLAALVHGAGARSTNASKGGPCDGSEAAAVVDGAKEVLQAWAAALASSSLLRTDSEACAHDSGQQQGAAQGAGAHQAKAACADALHLLLLLQAVAVAGGARRRAWSKVPALEAALKDACTHVLTTIRAVQERVAHLEVSTPHMSCLCLCLLLAACRLPLAARRLVWYDTARACRSRAPRIRRPSRGGWRV